MRQSPPPRVVIVAARNEGERIGRTVASGSSSSRWSIESPGALRVAFSTVPAGCATFAAPREPGAR